MKFKEFITYKSLSREANEKRHKHFATLIKATRGLIGDKLFLSELLIKHGFAGDEFLISDKSEFDTREKITIQFGQLIPEICEDLFLKDLPIPIRRSFLPKKISENKTAENKAFETNDEGKAIGIAGRPKYKFDEECYKMLGLLHELILKDYSINGNPDILQVLLQNNLSPLSQSAILPKNQSFEEDGKDEHIKEIKKIQRFFKSVKRKKIHNTLFGETPREGFPIPRNIEHNSRIVKAIHKLTANRSIVNTAPDHWTTEQNLNSIIRNRCVYGNETLKKQGIFFREASLESGDVKNGDRDVICFCPYMVDYFAFYNKESQHLKKGVVRLTVNLEKSESYGRYN